MVFAYAEAPPGGADEPRALAAITATARVAGAASVSVCGSAGGLGPRRAVPLRSASCLMVPGIR